MPKDIKILMLYDSDAESQQPPLKVRKIDTIGYLKMYILYCKYIKTLNFIIQSCSSL